MKPQAQQRVHAADPAAVRGRRTEVVIVSSDDSFLIELGPVLGDRYRTRTVDHPEGIAQVTEAARWIGIVDAIALADARAAVARMEQQYRGAEIIVITKTSEEWMSTVARGAVIATVARDQIGSARLMAMLAAAEARLLDAQPDSAAPDTGTLHPGTSHSGTSQPGALHAGTPPQRPRGVRAPHRIRAAQRAGWLLLAAGVACALAGWWLLHGRAPPPPAARTSGADQPPAAATAALARPQSVLELLSAARIAFRDQRLLLPRLDGEPRGDSALELYTQVLGQEPGNDEALDGMRRLFAIARPRIQSDLTNGKLEEANHLLGYFNSAGIDAEGLRDLQTQMQAARPRWLVAKAEDSIAAADFAATDQLLAQLSAAGADRATLADLHRAVDARKLELQLAVMADEVKASIDAGALLDPPTDNARARLQAMRSIGRTSPLTLATQHALHVALLAQAQEATRKEQFEAAQRYLAADADIGPATELAEARRVLQSAMELAAQRAAAAGAAADPRATAAADAAADAQRAQPAVPRVPPILAARPLKPLNVSYPSEAAEEGVRGYAIVEFTLNADGSPSDASVVEAQPAHVFDRAATSAVLHARYDASGLIDNQPQRARIRLTFKPG